MLSIEEIYMNELNGGNNWDEIGKHKYLSENLIREFQDKIDWDWVDITQKLPKEFIEEFKNKQERK